MVPCGMTFENLEKKEAVQRMVSHNNHAERPFGVVKEFWRMCPTHSMQNLSWVTHSFGNGTHRCAEVFGHHNKLIPVTTRLAGIALTTDPCLKRAVNQLCSVRRKSLGRVTILARAAHKNDKAAQVTNKKRKAIQKHDAQIRKQARTAAARDKAEKTACTSLCTNINNLDIELKARDNKKESRITYSQRSNICTDFRGTQDYIQTWEWNGVRQVVK
jgi:hypothetical protein